MADYNNKSLRQAIAGGVMAGALMSVLRQKNLLSTD
jgi:hypothetical protein